jgi:hypothetical protein
MFVFPFCDQFLPTWHAFQLAVSKAPGRSVTMNFERLSSILLAESLDKALTHVQEEFKKQGIDCKQFASAPTVELRVLNDSSWELGEVDHKLRPVVFSLPKAFLQPSVPVTSFLFLLLWIRFRAPSLRTGFRCCFRSKVNQQRNQKRNAGSPEPRRRCVAVFVCGHPM